MLIFMRHPEHGVMEVYSTDARDRNKARGWYEIDGPHGGPVQDAAAAAGGGALTSSGAIDDAGEVATPPPQTVAGCSVCGAPVYSKGMCSPHYYAAYRAAQKAKSRKSKQELQEGGQ